MITDDDVAVETSTYSTGRRGVAGTLIVEKIVGAAAEEKRDLATLKALGERVNARTRSMGVALTSCTVPAAGRPTFDIASRRDRARSGHPRRTGSPAGQAHAGRRHRRGDGGRRARRSRRGREGRGDPARQRVRRDAAMELYLMYDAPGAS